MEKLTDLQFVKSILPLHYNLREFPDCIRCVSRTGIDDSNGDNEWKTTVMEPLRKHFGNRFQEVYHSTCTNHVDFTIYFKQIDEPAKPKPNSMKQIKTASEVLTEIANGFGYDSWNHFSVNNPTDFVTVQSVKAMQTYAQQFKPEWTAVEDGLPEVSGYYLVYNSKYQYNNTCRMYYDKTSLIFRDENSDSYDCTHWQPLPSLPNPKQ